LALADGAIKASVAERAKQQLHKHKEEEIHNLASELVTSDFETTNRGAGLPNA
jgi:hypothetical protein